MFQIAQMLLLTNIINILQFHPSLITLNRAQAYNFIIISNVANKLLQKNEIRFGKHSNIIMFERFVEGFNTRLSCNFI